MSQLQAGQGLPTTADEGSAIPALVFKKAS